MSLDSMTRTSTLSKTLTFKRLAVTLSFMWQVIQEKRSENTCAVSDTQSSS